MNVKDLIERLERLPKDYKIKINVDNSYSSIIRSIYIDAYEKNKGRDVVSIKV